MNSNYGKPMNSQKGGSVSLNNFDFDLGLSSNRPRSLNDQKHHTSSYSYSSSSSSYPSFSSTQTRPATTSSWQPNKPSWTHQPATGQSVRPGLSNGSTSMAGDIFGKSWVSAAPSGPSAGVGIVNKSPNLFGDLVSSALGQQGRSNSNAPLKNATPVSAPATEKTPYSMGNLTDSLPKMNNSSSNWGSSENFGSFTSAYNNSGSSNNVNKSPNLGGPSMRSGDGGGMGVKKDPFGSLFDSGSKKSSSLNAANKKRTTNVDNDAFGSFQNASKSGMPASQPNANSANYNSFKGSGTASGMKSDDFGIPSQGYASQSQPSVQPPSGDPLDMFFTSSLASTTAIPAAAQGVGSQQFSEGDDWGMNSEFGGGGNDSGTTTELEGLPPPPAGVSASAAMNKGMDNQKQGQYPDAIKWLSWAVILFEKAGDDAATKEILSCRASCYKEVGEYKKAVADCTKVLEHDSANVSVLVQRALLYESMEKYNLGAEDLRTVMKLDPGNRVARSTIHRLTKMAG